jgi:hypothetical protein
MMRACTGDCAQGRRSCDCDCCREEFSAVRGILNAVVLALAIYAVALLLWGVFA